MIEFIRLGIFTSELYYVLRFYESSVVLIEVLNLVVEEQRTLDFLKNLSVINRSCKFNIAILI